MFTKTSTRKEMCAKVAYIFVVLIVIPLGSCLRCYKCYDTSRQCYRGDINYLDILNCTKNEVCATFKYEMEDSTGSYVTTIRGCQLPNEGICSQLMQTKRRKTVIQKGILCETCETDLCNSAGRNLSILTLTIVMSLIFLIV